MKILLSVVALAVVCVYSVSAGVIRVPQDSSTIQAAINAAVNGDTVLVSEGTYFENLVVTKKITVASLYLTDGDTSHISKTVIDGGSPSNPDSASVILVLPGTDSTTIIKGFTIQNGTGTFLSFVVGGVGYPYRVGGGIAIIADGGATISTNIIKNNSCQDLSGHTVGAGIAILPDTNVTIGPNAWVIENNTIVNNNLKLSVESDGGGLDITGRGRVVNNVIMYNVASGSSYGIGGGVLISGAPGEQNIEFSNNLVKSNSATYLGGGISMIANVGLGSPVVTLKNNIIVNNSATTYGGAIEITSGSYSFINNTIAGNSGSAPQAIFLEATRGPLTFRLMNNIIWNPAVASEFNTTSYVTSGYNCVRGGLTGTGNISSNPFFVPNDSLYRLTDSSNAIGKGIDSLQLGGVWYYAPGNDYFGSVRPSPAGTKPDIGAFEHVRSTSITEGNAMLVRKYEDRDGDLATHGDWVLKNWHLEVRKGSMTGPLVASGDTSTLSLLNLGDATYYIIEADSAGWLHLGNGTTGVVNSSTANNVSISLSNDGNADVVFVDAPPIYGQTFRSFRPDSIAYDVDNKGKPRKAVKKKPLTDDFALDITNPNGFAANLKLSFSMKVVGYVFEGSETLATLASVKTVLVNAVDSAAALSVVGTGDKGKAIVVKYDWYNPSTNKKITGQSGTISSYQYNNPQLPMPNRLNVLDDEYMGSAFSSTNGLLVGVPQGDATKKYLAWVVHKKSGDIVKSLYHKDVGIHSCDARGFDFKTNACTPDPTKILGKLQGSLSPKVQNNSLFANLVALKASIAASALGITPNGFGELIYDDHGSNSLNGMMLKDIAAFGDTLITGYTTDDTVIKNGKPVVVKGRHFADSATYANLNTVVSYVVSAFEGPVDTTSWSSKLVLKGTARLVDVPFLHASPSVVPTRIVPSLQPAQEPLAYRLYQNYPNPFNPTTTIRFTLPDDGFVTLKVYNVLGQEVATLLNHEQMEYGTQEVEFDASNLASGVYFYRIMADGVNEDGVTSSFVTVKKMMLVK